MRADRLLLLLTTLQTRGRVTTARLAEELEVSRRTIIRDLYALRVAGFPVNTERGPSGGCWLDDDFRNRLLRLTQAELAALFTTNIPAPLVELGVAGDLQRALLKLSASLPASRSDVADQMGNRVHLDSVPWSAPREAVRHLSTLHQAVLETRWVRATFDRARGIRSVRRIAPHGLVAKATTWYVVWAGEDGQLRVDRVARVLEAELEVATFVRRDGFDLAEFWKAWCLRQEESASRFSATVRVSAAALADLQGAASLHVAVSAQEAQLQDSALPYCVEITFGSIEEARSRLLAYGGSVEVIEPLALRMTLADFAQEAAAVYADQPAEPGCGSIRSEVMAGSPPSRVPRAESSAEF